MLLALMQRLAGDTAGAKVTAEQARNTLEQLYKDQPDNASSCGMACLKSYAADGGKGLGPKGSGACNHAWPRAKDPVYRT